MSETTKTEAFLSARLSLHIHIGKPQRGDDFYHLPLTITAPDGSKNIEHVGLQNANFKVRHHEAWDSYLPLMYITRNGGPLFGTQYSRAVVQADFPLHAAIAAFFQARASRFGLNIEIASSTFERVYDERTQGDMVLFGGGKDSRLLLGTLREIGGEPAVISARGSSYAADIPQALTYDASNFAMPARIVPALMLNPRNVYHGSGLGEVHLNQPWQQYFDISANAALLETSRLLQSIGFDITIHAPQSTLPYNLVQKILSVRYPELAAGQISVTPYRASEKNLHVCLLKDYHGIDFSDHSTSEMYASMTTNFVKKSMKQGDEIFGLYRNREIINREMRTIIRRQYADGTSPLSTKLEPPIEWDEPWIDFIHSYCNPDLSPALLEIFSIYAECWDLGMPGLPAGLAAYADMPSA